MDQRASDIIFSLEGGEVWVSWYGHSSRIALGTEAHVTEMMRDFLAQCEVGARLRNESH
jgi:hypothetical protein